jgi:membrane-associated protein
MDPMYWLGDGGVFGSALLIGVMVIILSRRVCCFRYYRATHCCSRPGVIAAQATTPVDG